jgi:GNAT superfamily N-acetyltransferase
MRKVNNDDSLFDFRVIGCSIAEVYYHSGCSLLGFLVVDEAYRGKGYARVLVDAAETKSSEFMLRVTGQPMRAFFVDVEQSTDNPPPPLLQSSKKKGERHKNDQHHQYFPADERQKIYTHLGFSPLAMSLPLVGYMKSDHDYCLGVRLNPQTSFSYLLGGSVSSTSTQACCNSAFIDISKISGDIVPKSLAEAHSILMQSKSATVDEGTMDKNVVISFVTNLYEAIYLDHFEYEAEKSTKETMGKAEDDSLQVMYPKKDARQRVACGTVDARKLQQMHVELFELLLDEEHEEEQRRRRKHQSKKRPSHSPQTEVTSKGRERHVDIPHLAQIAAQKVVQQYHHAGRIPFGSSYWK